MTITVPGWSRHRLKFSTEINRSSLPDSTDPDFEFDYVDISRVSLGVIDAEPQPTVFSTSPSRARRLANPGDTIVSTVRTYLRAVAEVAESEVPQVFSTGFAVIAGKPETLYPRFLTYFLQSAPFVERVMADSVGVSYPAINASDIAAYDFWAPSVEQQQTIADFLDRETAQIDAMVDAQDRLISSLAERRATLIHTLVTKGLTESVEMRDSGSQWLGDVPAHWSVENIRRQAQMRTGHTPSRSVPEFWEECDVPWMTLADVWQLRPGRIEYVSETDEMVSRLGIANSAAELLPSGTVMLSRTASVGFSGIMSQPMATSQDFWNWVCRPTMLPEYLLYTFRAMHQEFEALRRGSTHQTIYKPVAAGFIVPVPPLSEQREIVSRIRRSLQAMDEMSDAATEVVRLLRERREALISAAVTGRIDPTTGTERIDPPTEKEAS